MHRIRKRTDMELFPYFYLQFDINLWIRLRITDNISPGQVFKSRP